MQVEHIDKNLERLETDREFNGGFPENIVRAFRKRMQFVRQAKDERDLRAIKSNHFEKMQGKLAGQYSIRLNDQLRLLFRFEDADQSKKIVIIAIKDPHK